MTDQPTQQELLVAVDFSPCSQRALDAALRWRGDGELTLLHVLDSALAEHIEQLGLGSTDAVLRGMRARAEDELDRMVADRGAERVETMVVVGEPFVGIVRIANAPGGALL